MERGVDQLVDRQAHNLKAAGSNPAPATPPWPECDEERIKALVERIPKMSNMELAALHRSDDSVTQLALVAYALRGETFARLLESTTLKVPPDRISDIYRL